MDRGSSKHSPRVDDELEQETESITHSGQPAHTEEWRETEPMDESHLDTPADQAPGLTPAEIDRRSEIARYLPPPHELPATRGGLLSYLERTGAPDEVVAEIRRLPAGQEYTSAGQIARALGIPEER